jgi:hypothetical protein
MRPRSFRVRPADDDEFLAIEAFCFAPEASVARRKGASIVLETTPSSPSWPACFRINSPSPVSWPLN